MGRRRFMYLTPDPEFNAKPPRSADAAARLPKVRTQVLDKIR